MSLNQAGFDFQEKRSSFSQRRGECGMADKVSDWRAAPRLEPGVGPSQTWEGRKTVPRPEEGGSKSSTRKAGSSSENRVSRESGGTRPSMSFAEMAKRGGGGGDLIEKSSRNLNNLGVEISEGGSRQTGPCLSQVPSFSSFNPRIGSSLISKPGGTESDICLYVWQDWQIV